MFLINKGVVGRYVYVLSFVLDHFFQRPPFLYQYSGSFMTSRRKEGCFGIILDSSLSWRHGWSPCHGMFSTCLGWWPNSASVWVKIPCQRLAGPWWMCGKDRGGGGGWPRRRGQWFMRFGATCEAGARVGGKGNAQAVWGREGGAGHVRSSGMRSVE